MKSKHFIWYFSLLLLLQACAKERTPVPRPDSGDQVTVSFLAGVPVSTMTRSGSLVSDNQIKTIEILSFTVEDEGGNSVERFFYSTQAITITDTDKDHIKLVTARVQKSEKTQRFILIANAREAVSDQLPTVGTEKTSYLSSLEFQNKNQWSNLLQQFVPIPMWGETKSLVVSDTSDPTLELELLRMAARVDVAVSDEIASDFVVSEIRVYHPYSRGRIVPNLTNLAQDNGETVLKALAPTLAQDQNASDPLILNDIFLFDERSDDGFLPSVYLFEAAKTAVGDENNATALVIGAKYKDDVQPTYYRLDFAQKDNNGHLLSYKDILRNHRYLFKITAVEGRGYAGYQEAYEAGDASITVDLYHWTEGDITDYVFNSQYALGVGPKTFEVDKSAAGYSLLVTTDYPKGWTATVDPALYDWITLEPYTFGGVDSKDKLTFKVEENPTLFARTAVISITAGTLKQTVTVVQLPEEGISLRITDTAGEVCDELLFVRYPGNETAMSQPFTVNWTPSSAAVTLQNIQTGDAAFHFGSGDNPVSTGTLTSSPKNFSIRPADFTVTELDPQTGNPFLEKGTRLYYTLENEGTTITKGLDLRQISLDLIADQISDPYPLDGLQQEFRIRSNVSWTALVTDDPSGIIRQIDTKTGTENTSGQVFLFVTEDDPNQLIGSGKATITFYCESQEGITFSREVTIYASSSAPVITGANSYMLKPSGSSVSIPINWANKDGNPRFKASDDLQIEFIWTDHASGMSSSGVVSDLAMTGSGINRKLVVTPGNAIGNALVGVSVGDNLLWSWHIWVTDYDPQSDQVYNRNGFVMMDRNLGATSGTYGTPQVIGQFYQWGRKDPFPPTTTHNIGSTTRVPLYSASQGSVSITVSATPTGNNLENAISHPTTFFTGTNWYSTIVNNDELWNQADGSKGFYDPCPEGWRVPVNTTSRSPWLNFIDTDHKWNTTPALYVTLNGLGNWQTGGNISGSTGNYISVGMYGFNWSGSVNGTYGVGISYGTSYQLFSVQQLANRSTGYNVRCVKE